CSESILRDALRRRLSVRGASTVGDVRESLPIGWPKPLSAAAVEGDTPEGVGIYSEMSGIFACGPGASRPAGSRREGACCVYRLDRRLYRPKEQGDLLSNPKTSRIDTVALLRFEAQ